MPQASRLLRLVHGLILLCHLVVNVSSFTPSIPITAVTSIRTSPCSFLSSMSSSSSSSAASTVLRVSSSSNDNNKDESSIRSKSSSPPSVSSLSLRDSLRQATGFSLTAARAAGRAATGISWTAIRATCRAATGISLTAVYATTLAATGQWIRQASRVLLSLLPPWLRYFLQPLLVLYYAPLFLLRNLAGPTTRRQARQAHERLVNEWKLAVDKADHTVSYWPVHLNEDGYIEADSQEVDLNEVVQVSVQVALEEEEIEKSKLKTVKGATVATSSSHSGYSS